MLHQLILVLKGFFMGAADVVPGVSGGTMALILGIYTRLIDAIKSFDSRWLKALIYLDFKTALTRPDLVFIVPLATGIVLALYFFTRVVSLPGLIESHPELIYSLFSGLIFGSIIVLCYQVREHLLSPELMLFILGALMGYFLFNLVPVETPESAWFILLCGIVAISAMILPGVSGSFILLILKKYSYIFNAIGHFQLTVLLPFVLGLFIGLALFSRLLSWLLKLFYERTILFICGLLLASLTVVWPYMDRTYVMKEGTRHLVAADPYLPASLSSEVIFALCLFLLGIVTVIVIHRGAGAKTT